MQACSQACSRRRSPLLQAAAQSPTAARMRGRLITTTALTMSMAGRYKEPGKGRRCAR